jgi:hypothetical protein
MLEHAEHRLRTTVIDVLHILFNSRGIHIVEILYSQPQVFVETFSN